MQSNKKNKRLMFFFTIPFLMGIFLNDCNRSAINNEKTDDAMERISDINFTINSNGSKGVLEQTTGEYFIYSLPDKHLLTRLESDGTVLDVKLSNSGNCYAVRRIDHQLEVFHKKEQKNYKLPFNREEVYDWTIADDGKSLLVLKILFQTELETDPVKNGALEIWSLPIKQKPIVTYKVPIYGYGRIIANDFLNKIAVQSEASVGEQAYLKLLTYDEEKNIIEVLNEFEGEPLTIGFPIINKDWIWAVSKKEIMGWNNQESKSIEGSLRERMIFSLDGKYLLIYKIEMASDQNKRELIFRLIDLSDLKEIKKGTASPTPALDASFVLTEKLKLIEVGFDEQGQIKTQALKWVEND